MPKFCANLSLLFTEHEWPERFDAAAQAGFDAVEIQFPYHLEKQQLVDLLAKANQQLVLLNLPAGDWQAGERGIACLPGREQEFKQGVAQAIDYALATGCKQINCLSGIRPAELHPQQALALMAERLGYAADQLAEHQLQLNIEAINSYDIPGFLVDRSQIALELIQQLRRTNIRIQYDLYHMYRMEAPLQPKLESLLPQIGHIQIADHPGRHEPGTGKIDFLSLLNQLDALGYTGRVALEYNPMNSTSAGLGWLRSYSDKN